MRRINIALDLWNYLLFEFLPMMLFAYGIAFFFSWFFGLPFSGLGFFIVLMALKVTYRIGKWSWQRLADSVRPEI